MGRHGVGRGLAATISSMGPHIAMGYRGRPRAEDARGIPAYFEVQQDHEGKVGIDLPGAYCLIATWLDAVVG